ncbi:MAG: hypothetical protein KGL40_02670 [Rhodocyclaceae bacterium]|nr:hypothetical protein [Rhodocyclaceae bacterium]
MTKVALKVINAGAYAEVVREKLPFSSVENGIVVMRSQLDASAPLNDHLVWLWGLVQHQRRVLKTAVESGAQIVCECSAQKGSVHVLPNGAEMLHLLGAELSVEVK